MKLRSSLISCASLLTILLSASTFAENRANAFTFTLAGGPIHFASKRDMQSTGTGFVGLGYDFTDRWGIEGILGSFHTQFNNSNPDRRTIDGTLFAIDGAYHVAPYYQFLEPFVLAGVGVLGMNPSGNDPHNQGNINAALGAEMFIHHSIAFRLEARDFYTIVGGKNDWMADVGMTFFMGGCPTSSSCH